MQSPPPRPPHLGAARLPSPANANRRRNIGGGGGLGTSFKNLFRSGGSETSEESRTRLKAGRQTVAAFNDEMGDFHSKENHVERLWALADKDGDGSYASALVLPHITIMNDPPTHISLSHRTEASRAAAQDLEGGVCIDVRSSEEAYPGGAGAAGHAGRAKPPRKAACTSPVHRHRAARHAGRHSAWRQRGPELLRGGVDQGVARRRQRRLPSRNGARTLSRWCRARASSHSPPQPPPLTTPLFSHSSASARTTPSAHFARRPSPPFPLS
jgi:hypothetical protein